MASDLRARLEAHEKAFEGLMSLIPAEQYYGKEDTDNQWKRKKQSKEEKRAAKKAKLMPGAQKSALDVHRENERASELKRKRGDGDAADSDVEGKEEPLKASLDVVEQPSKKRKKDAQASEPPKTEEERRQAKIIQKKEKRERQKAKEAKKREKVQAAKARKRAERQNQQGPSDKSSSSTGKKQKSSSSQQITSTQDKTDAAEDEDEDDEDGVAADVDMDKIDVDGLVDNESVDDNKSPKNPAKVDEEADWSDASSADSPGNHDSPTFEEQSAASSSSSIQPPPETDETKTSTQDQQLPKIDHDSLVARLQSKIAAMRDARNADGLDGKPARTRTELIEARRAKEEKRKAARKEARNAQRANDADAEAARLRGGEGSPLWSIPGLPSGSLTENLSFGSVRFADGATTTADATAVREARKRKGATDTKTRLAGIEEKEKRLGALDADKQASIAEKEAWQNARRRIAGEKVKDSASLLRKTLKRSEKSKAKSEKEWDERIGGVKAAREAKQRRRESNLAKRKEEKGVPKAAKKKGASSGGSKGGKGGQRWGISMNKGKKSSGPAKKRPGFEGTFKIGGRS